MPEQTSVVFAGTAEVFGQRALDEAIALQAEQDPLDAALRRVLRAMKL